MKTQNSRVKDVLAIAPSTGIGLVVYHLIKKKLNEKSPESPMKK